MHLRECHAFVRQQRLASFRHWSLLYLTSLKCHHYICTVPPQHVVTFSVRHAPAG